MIGSIIGFTVTLLGAYAGGALVKRWNIGPVGAVSLGWAMGMVFALIVVAASMAPGGQP
jgi:hypothetical protein